MGNTPTGPYAMLSISATSDWQSAHPQATIGLLELSGVDNTQPSSALNAQKRMVEAQLRTRCQGFTRREFLALPVMAAYVQYYKQFNKTYHVQLQVESIVLKGKNLPDVSPLVDANFAAEVETFVLTAGHDVAKLQGEICMDIAREGDEMIQMNGTPKALYPGDMVMRDVYGVCCTILYGQDNRSPISPDSTHVLYVAYAPRGVPAEQVEEHLEKIESYVRLSSPHAVREQLRLLCA